MNRRINRRLDRLEELEKATLAVREQRAWKHAERLRKLAHDHASKVVAICLLGDPKVDEPLRFARDRMFESLHIVGINPVARSFLVQNFVESEVPGDTANVKFAHVLRSAPQWLLEFCRCEIDARLLGFDLPIFPDPSPEPGLVGREEMFLWPDLPSGTLGAGGPPEPNPFEVLSLDEFIAYDAIVRKGEKNWSRGDRRRRKEIMIKIIEHMRPSDRESFDRLLEYFKRSLGALNG